MKLSSISLASLAIVGALGETTQTFTEYASTTTIIETIFSAPPGEQTYSPSSTISSVSSIITDSTSSKSKSIIPSDSISEVSTFSSGNWSFSRTRSIISSSADISTLVSSALESSSASIETGSSIVSSPVESTSVESSAVESTSVESSAVESSAVESTSVESTPAESTPAESTPVESTPVESTPVESTPVESTSVGLTSSTESSSLYTSDATTSESTSVESVSSSVSIEPEVTPTPSTGVEESSSTVDVEPSNTNTDISSLTTSTSTTPTTPVTSPEVTQAPSSTTQETTTSSSSTTQALGSFEAAILEAHNQKRALHGVPPLVWDQTIADYGANYAAGVFDCNNVQLVHSGGPYGENLGVGNFGSDIGVVDAWYDEIKDYDFSKPGFSEATGHFTQVVWKSTSKLGCARIMCDNAWSQYTICEYTDDRGNIIGTDPATGTSFFESNVLPPL